MLTLTNRIDMRPGAVPLVIHLGQYDSDFSLVFELYSSAGNFTVESGTTAMIRGTKTDGHAYDADATIDVSAKTVTVAGSEQMTAAKGRNVYELVLKKGTKVLSTANFILDVERAAMDADTIASESVLKELNAIIAGAETATEAAADAAAAADSVSSASAQIATNAADIADLKADLDDLAEEVESHTGLSDEVKEALLNCFQHVAWIDETSKTYYDALEEALYGGSSGYPRLEAVYTPGSHVVYTDDDLSTLRPYLTVKQIESEGDSGTVITDYTLSGTLRLGDSAITIRKEGMRTNVSVNARYAMRQTNNDFVVQHNTAGYTDGIGANIYLDTVASKDSTRRRIVTNSGSVPYVYYQSGGTPTASEFYPIHVPAQANSIKITATTDGLATGFILAKLNNGVYELYDTVAGNNFTAMPIERYFDASEDLYMLLYMRKTDNSAFDSSSEPAGIVIDFGAIDLYDQHEFVYPSGMLGKIGNMSADDDESHYGIQTNSTATNRYLVGINKGVAPIYDITAGAYTNIYPIPIPADATSITLNYTTGTVWGAINIWRWNGLRYTLVKDLGSFGYEGGGTKMFEIENTGDLFATSVFGQANNEAFTQNNHLTFCNYTFNAS